MARFVQPKTEPTPSELLENLTSQLGEISASARSEDPSGLNQMAEKVCRAIAAGRAIAAETLPHTGDRARARALLLEAQSALKAAGINPAPRTQDAIDRDFQRWQHKAELEIFRECGGNGTYRTLQLVDAIARLEGRPNVGY